VDPKTYFMIPENFYPRLCNVVGGTTSRTESDYFCVITNKYRDGCSFFDLEEIMVDYNWCFIKEVIIADQVGVHWLVKITSGYAKNNGSSVGVFKYTSAVG